MRILERNNKVSKMNKYWSTYLYDSLPEFRQPILELGCGSGIPQVQSKYRTIFQSKNYLGIDLSKCILNSKQENILDFQFLQKYNTILSIAFFEHLTLVQIINLLEKCKKTLKPNGQLIIMVPYCETPYSYLKNDSKEGFRQNKELGLDISHKTFYHTKALWKYLLPSCKTKIISYPIRFREDDCSYLKAIFRLFKRFLTFNKLVWNRFLRRNRCLMIVYEK